MQLLRYLYRIRDGMPAFDWGLKLDLPQRIANGGVFHGAVPQTGDAPQLAAVGSNPMLEGLL
jgi:hypothetical protein